MDNPFELLMPMAGFVVGLLLWSRVAHIGIAVSGLTPSPAKPREDFAALAIASRRLVPRIAATWMILFGTVLVYLLYREKTGFALLFAGIEAVPLLTVTLFFKTMRRLERRMGSPKSQTFE